MSERVLVTGGAGFLGSHLCRRLLDEGAEVICLDSFLTGSRAKVDALTASDRFELIEHDLTEPLDPDLRFTALMHLASPASPPAYLANPIHTLRVGSLGTFHALEAALRCDADFLITSTSEVYGDPEVHPQPESYHGNVSTTGPRSVYDESKRFAEAATMAYHRTHGLRTRIARIFNTYGPGMEAGDGRAIPEFVTRALAGEPVVVFGDGSQTRSFCYVDDMIEGLLALLRSDERLPVNLGNPDERSLLDVARLVIELIGSDSRIEFAPLPQDDPIVRRPDITRARELLGWEPRVGFREGLERTIEAFRREAAGSRTSAPSSPATP
jgi:dTDP-glucose 4,6-dehydratase